MSDEPLQPPTDPTAPDLIKHADEAPAPRESIWQPLDGSAPPSPTAANVGAAPGAPSTFRKPEPRPLTLQPAPAAPAPIDPQTGQAVFVLAAWWPRVGAYVIDNLLIGVALLVIAIPAAVAAGMTVEEAAQFYGGQRDMPGSVVHTWVPWAMVGLQLVLPPIIQAVFLQVWKGQTPGKRALGLRVVPEDGSALQFPKALRRELTKTVAAALTVPTLGLSLLGNYLWPLRDPQNRAGHDFVAKTRVVTAPRS